MEIVKRSGERAPLDVTKMRKVIHNACLPYPECDPLELEMDAQVQFQDGMTTREIQKLLIRTAAEKTTVDRPNWQFVASALLVYDLYKEARLNREYDGFGYGDLWSLLEELTKLNVYGEYLMEAYSIDEIDELGAYIKPERDFLFNYIGLKTLSDRYIKRKKTKEIMELPQERFMVIAMHLASVEEPSSRVKYAKDYYDMYSRLEVTPATPTLANAGTTHPQLSSCFIDTVPDDLSGIYQVDADFAQVSKHGGGQGIYMGKVRARGGDIRGYKGVSGGVVPWIKNYNNTATAVDQLGVRAGAVAVYLDVWHKDILDFLNLKTNNGDDRMKAHDIFPGVCIPDIFMRRAKAGEDFSLFCPKEVHDTFGWYLEDCYDEEKGSGTFTDRYLACEAHPLLSRETIPAKEIMKRILSSAFETGTPFAFFRDAANRANPMKASGMIYCTNLCTEIFQNMSSTILGKTKINKATGKFSREWEAGDFVVCNLSSINMGRVRDRAHLKWLAQTIMRALDAVVSLNAYPIPQAAITSAKYRPVGAGVHGYHQWLAQQGISWESDEHVKAADAFFEAFAFEIISASNDLAGEKGAAEMSQDSEWETGEYFERRGYVRPGYEGLDPREMTAWEKLARRCQEYGVRNTYMIAVAPTGSTSLIAGSTAGIDPVYKKFFVEEKKNGVMPQTAPNLNDKTFWFYKEAHTIDQHWSIDANAARQRHIDQGQSFNLYVTPQITAREFMDLYVHAWEVDTKSIYYVRNESLDVEDCVSCSG